ncbi:MAG: conjugal transfer protein TraH, partial [Candidatus Zixiibacteriota bacterium]
LYQPGSYLEKAVNATQVASTTWNLNLTDIARGYIGDFYTEQTNDLGSIRPIAPCSNNKWVRVWDDLKEGKVEARPSSGGNCGPIADLKDNMNVYTQDMMNSIVAKMRNPANAVLTSAERTFIETTPFPVFTHMMMAVSESSEMVNAYITGVNNIVAEAFSVNIMINLFEETEKMLVHYKELITNKKMNTGTTAGEHSLDTALSNVETLRKRLHDMNTDALMNHFRVLRLEYETATIDLRNRSDTFDKVVAGAKKHELPRMKVFRVEEHLFGSEDIGRLADLPPRDQLLSMVVAAVESPFSALVGTLDGFFRELVGVIDALADKRQGEA